MTEELLPPSALPARSSPKRPSPTARPSPSAIRGPQSALAIQTGIALAAASATIVLVYAGIRAVQAIFYPEPDPALVVWSSRAAMFWRFWIGLYIGGMVGFGAFALANRSPVQAAKWLVRVVVVAAISITLQGLFLP